MPQDPVTAEEQKTLYCRSCQKYYPSTEFSVSSTNANIGKCRQCLRLENIANKRTDQTKFKYDMFLKIYFNQNGRFSLDFYLKRLRKKNVLIMMALVVSSS